MMAHKSEKITLAYKVENIIFKNGTILNEDVKKLMAIQNTRYDSKFMLKFDTIEECNNFRENNTINFHEKFEPKKKSLNGYTDASFSPVNKIGAYANIILFKDNMLTYNTKKINDTKSTQVEILGGVNCLINMIDMAIRRNINQVNLYFDCFNIFRAIMTKKGLDEKAINMIRLASKLGIEINLIHTKAHKNDGLNILMDALAKKAIGIPFKNYSSKEFYIATKMLKKYSIKMELNLA